jgi:hypothetical protein
VANLKFITVVDQRHAIKRGVNLRNWTSAYPIQLDTNGLVKFTINNSALRGFFRASYVS